MQMKESPRLSVAIPVHNEVSVLPELLSRLLNVLNDLPGGPHEIIFVDDGSTDETFALLEEAEKRSIRKNLTREKSPGPHYKLWEPLAPGKEFPGASYKRREVSPFAGKSPEAFYKRRKASPPRKRIHKGNFPRASLQVPGASAPRGEIPWGFL